jgi:diaminopimelate decarboxylase
MKEFLIGPFSALSLAERFGTPTFIYDSARIKRQYEKIKNAFCGLDHRIHYASKANESREILRYLKDLGAGVDTVSPNEVKRALQLGYQLSDIIFTPSCPSISELQWALDEGIRIHFGGLEYLEILGEQLNGVEIGIRINPALAIEGNQKISTAHAHSKFGVPLDQMDRLKELVKKYNIQLKTLHIHSGSDVKNWKDLARSFDVLLALLGEFESVNTLDIGSGLKVKYYESDNQIDLAAYADYINKGLKKVNRPIQIIIEPGKFLVAESGYLLTQVNIVKKGYSTRFVGVNSGFHHLIRPMYYDAYHHIINISNMNDEVLLYDVVGQLCEEDTFARNIPLSKVRRGDYLVFENAGAYAYAMAMTYNLRERPSEVLIEGDIATLISTDQIGI